MLADLRFALRTFAKTPGFVLVAVLVLGLGIGANTAIFSVLNAVLLRALPYSEPDRLVMVWEKNPQVSMFLAERFPVSLENLLRWKQLSRSFDGLTAFQDLHFNLTGSGKPEDLEAARVPSDFGDVFGVRPALGRAFTAEETQPGRNRVAILSHSLFVRRFASNSQILGKTIELDHIPHTIVGVWPAQFHLPAMWQGFDTKKPEVWVPLDVRPAQPAGTLSARTNYVYGRLRDGVTLTQARADMEAIGRTLAIENPKQNTGFGVSVFPVAVEDIGPGTRQYVLLLQGAVAFVLLIACANVANLLMARSIGRRREMAIRLAIGATRFRLARQMLAESLVLSVAGGALGLLLAAWGIQAISALAPADLAHLHELRIDVPTLLFTLGAALLTGVILGIAPTVDAARRNVNEALHSGGRTGTGGASRRLRGILAASEVALALVLLVGAGLLIRTVREMLTADPGFRKEGLLTLRMSLPEGIYPSDAKLAAFSRTLLDRAAAVPGVVAASVAGGLPMQGLSFTNYSLDGAPAVAGAAPPMSSQRLVTEDYFRTMVIPLRLGRTFTRQEVEDPKSNSIVINETLAKKLWPGVDPIGRPLTVGGGRRVVIGVVADANQLGPEANLEPEVYMPSEVFRTPTLVVRTAGDPAALSTAVSQQVWSIDKDQPIQQVHTMTETLGEWVSERRFVMTLLGGFAALALILAAVGLYGVLAYSVSQRTREIGIRMALGASNRNVLRLFVSEGLAFTAAGIAAGAVGAFLLTKLMAGLLFRVSATDPWSFAGGATVLLVAAALASYVPARRAANLAPLDALRED
ncbi:MAG: ABC transporter permease [Bryobacteraceae bacterium]